MDGLKVSELNDATKSSLAKALGFIKGDVLCFGDSLTAGTYPSELQNLLGADYNVLNRGVGGESTLVIMARQGGIPMYVSNVTIPATTTPVTIGNDANSGLHSLFDDSHIKPLLQHTTNAGINPCYVDGIECNLAYSGGNFTLTRVTAGTERITGAKCIVFTESMRNYRDAIQIFFMGENAGWNNTPATLVSQFKKMVDSLQTRRFIVITTHGASNTADVTNALIAEFGANYFDLKGYLSTHAIYDAGLTPTQADLDAMALGNCPPQLLADTIHLTATGYLMLAQQLKQRFIELGY